MNPLLPVKITELIWNLCHQTWVSGEGYRWSYSMHHNLIQSITIVCSRAAPPKKDFSSWLVAISSVQWRAFREKCTFHMDNIIKEYLFLIWISLFKSRNVKVSIDRFLKTVRQVAWVSVNCWDAFHRNRDGRKRLLFVLFNSTTFCPYCECTQIKVQFWIMTYSFLHE